MGEGGEEAEVVEGEREEQGTQLLLFCTKRGQVDVWHCQEGARIVIKIYYLIKWQNVYQSSRHIKLNISVACAQRLSISISTSATHCQEWCLLDKLLQQDRQNPGSL